MQTQRYWVRLHWRGKQSLKPGGAFPYIELPTIIRRTPKAVIASRLPGHSQGIRRTLIGHSQDTRRPFTGLLQAFYAPFTNMQISAL